MVEISEMPFYMMTIAHMAKTLMSTFIAPAAFAALRLREASRQGCTANVPAAAPSPLCSIIVGAVAIGFRRRRLRFRRALLR